MTVEGEMLKLIHAEVKAAFPAINVRDDAWVWHFHGDHWEFHGPDNFYWHGTATSAADARARGWCAFLKSKGLEI